MANTMIRARNVQSSTPPRLSHFNISKLLYLWNVIHVFFVEYVLLFPLHIDKRLRRWAARPMVFKP